MRLTRRGERAFNALLLIAGAVVVAGIYYLATHIHYTGEGYCHGTFTQCYEKEGKK